MLGWFKKKKVKEEIQKDSVEETFAPVESEEEQPEIEEFQGTGIFGFSSSEEDQESSVEDESTDPNKTQETNEAELATSIPASENIEVPAEAQDTRDKIDELPPPPPEDKDEPEGETSPPQEEPTLEIIEEKRETPEEETGVVPDEAPTLSEPPKEGKTSLFKRLANKLSRTRESFVHQMDELFRGKKVIDADLLDDLEELLITTDIGVATSTELLDFARKKVDRNELSDPESLKKFIKEKLRTYIVDSSQPAELVMPDSGPFVIMVIGVNGVGKTTTIGKIAHKFLNSGQSVLLAAADTFRAAAVSQLQIWGERNNVEVVAKHEGADPSSVAFDAIDRAVKENYDVLLVDTAGRLHTQTNLMEELKKINRVMGKKLENAPHEILLVIDATTGQNGISQAKLFNEAVGVTGLALTKLDGTAKGGIVANISRDMKIPIRFIGIGEKIEDLRDFDPDEFIEALFQSQA